MPREELTPEELAQAVAASSDPRLNEVRLLKLPDGGLDDALAAIHHLVRNEGCQVIFFDYLQILYLEDSANYHIVIANAVKRLRMACSRLGVPLILGSQIRRLSQQQKEPRLTDFKEGGDTWRTRRR